MLEFLSLILFILDLGCLCKDLITSDGYGNCLKDPSCYVQQPSSCDDVKDSTVSPGEKWSFQACSQKGKIFGG